MVLTTQYWALNGFIVFSGLMLLIYFLMNQNSKYWAKRGVMELPRTLLLGNFGGCLFGKRALGQFLQDLHNQSKGFPYMGFYVFNKPIFLARDPELIKHIMVKDFNVFSNRQSTTDALHDRLGYANLFFMKNPAWKIHRTKLTQFSTTAKVKKMFDLMLLIAKDLENCLESMDLEGDGKVVEMKDLCANFTTDVIGSTVFGLKVNSLEKPYTPFRNNGRQIFSFNLRRGFEILIIVFLPEYIQYTRPKFFGRNTSFLRNVFLDVISERVRSREKRNDLIDLLIELRKMYENDTDLTDFKFNGDDVAAQAAFFFAAGYETSSTAMSFTLYELAVNQEIQKTLRKEIHNALEQSGGKITYEMITTLPYLDMVVSETLRKYPPVPFLDRAAAVDYKVPNSDLVLPKGTPVFISVMGVHRDPEYYPDPDKYDPSRFTKENIQKRPKFTYFPFGEGPHACVGLRLGLIQSKLGVLQLIKDYEVTVCDKTSIPMILDPRGITTRAKHGVYVNCRKLRTTAG